MYSCCWLQGRKFILSVIEIAAVRSKERMKAGNEPACLLDFWTQQILKECQVSMLIRQQQQPLTAGVVRWACAWCPFWCCLVCVHHQIAGLQPVSSLCPVTGWTLVGLMAACLSLVLTPVCMAVRVLQEAEENNVPPPKYSTNMEIAYTVMDFLFASQVMGLDAWQAFCGLVLGSSQSYSSCS